MVQFLIYRTAKNDTCNQITDYIKEKPSQQCATTFCIACQLSISNPDGCAIIVSSSRGWCNCFIVLFGFANGIINSASAGGFTAFRSCVVLSVDSYLIQRKYFSASPHIAISTIASAAKGCFSVCSVWTVYVNFTTSYIIKILIFQSFFRFSVCSVCTFYQYQGCFCFY